LPGVSIEVLISATAVLPFEVVELIVVGVFIGVAIPTLATGDFDFFKVLDFFAVHPFHIEGLYFIGTTFS